MLEDGTVVQLEPETRLRVRFGRKLRRVELEHGVRCFVSPRIRSGPSWSAPMGHRCASSTALGVESGSRGVVVTVAEGKLPLPILRRTKKAVAPRYS